MSQAGGAIGAAGDELELGNVRANMHNNSSAAVGPYFAKLIRRIEPGVHPELELTGMLTQQGFLNIPKLAGQLQFRGADKQQFSVAILSERVSNTHVYRIGAVARAADGGTAHRIGRAN